MKFVKLGDICKVRNGYAFKSEKFTESGVPIVRISDINDNYVNPLKSVRTNYENLFDNFKIVKGDILIAMSGATTGKFGIYNSDEDAYQNQRVGCFKILDKKIVDQTYLLQTLKVVKPIIEKKANGGAQPNISASGIEEITIPLPAISDQIRIAEILSQAESLIAQRKQSISLLDELLKSTFLEMFGDPVRNEKGWDKDYFENLVASDCPLTYGIVQPGEEFSIGIPVIRPVDLTRTYIDRTGLKLIDPKISDKFKRTLLKGNEILMCVRGTTGIVSLASKELAGCNVTRGIVPIWFSKNYNTFFAFGLLKTKAINNEIQGLTYGATLQQINLSDLRKIKLINPPIELQTKFAIIAEKVEALKNQYQQSLKELQNMYGVLSQKAFKGDLNLTTFEITNEPMDAKKKVVKVNLREEYGESRKSENMKKDISNLSLDEYLEIPRELIQHNDKWMFDFINDDVFYQFLLKDGFKDKTFTLEDIDSKYFDFFQNTGDIDFDYEKWKNIIFKFMETTPPLIEQMFEEETKTVKLKLTNEAYKA